MSVGKAIRLERIINRNTGRTVIVPMDHGVSIGPVEGLVNWKGTVNAVAEGGADAIVLHKGPVESGHRRSGRDVGLIIHLSASTTLAPDPHAKTLVCTLEEAIQLGADAVSIHINIGAEDEKSMLKDLGMIARQSQQWGFPLLAMMYTRGPRVKNQYDTALVKHAARVGAELGADIVKVPYTGSPETFHEVVEGCFVPVVIAGGEKMETDEDVLTMVKGSIEAGGSGVSIGRNVFQHRNPTNMVRAISRIVHQNAAVQDVLDLVRA
ncbi:MAG TPA: 2-amino-3,7-dideoxy-D-threo-hept-6-ulosonate synthase [Thermodesulfobacteriota bacterium]|nr:2-amino-3,7-dideoxy-D-threo-hept-6-ulosonate synthase [Thermodesulfobacteriota bacterium]